MIKDRFEQFRQIYEKNGKDEDEFMLAFDDIERKLPIRTQDFLAKATNIHQRVNLAKQLIEELQKKQIEILIASNINDVLNEERDQLLSTIKEITTYIHTDIKTLETEAEEDKFGQMDVEDKIKRDQVNVLLVLFQDVMLEYNDVQMKHREQCKVRIVRQLEISGSTKTSEEIEDMIENGNTDIFQSQLFIETESTREALRDVEERHVEILKLEQSIKDLLEIFQEVACMVDQQGDMIDNIERNVQSTAMAVHTGREQMKRAYKYKRRKLLTLCCPCVSLYRSCSIL